MLTWFLRTGVSLVLLGSLGLLSSCGGGGGDSTPHIPDTTPIFFTFTGSAVEYVVEEGIGALSIVAEGASGGATAGFDGGFGARVQSVILVVPGERITIVVGQQPSLQTDAQDGCGASGGGGTFIARGITPLAVAGGGGGATGFTLMNGGSASLNTDGGGTLSVPGGSNGDGGAASPGEGGGGAGFSTNGGDASGSGGQAFLDGGHGGGRDPSEGCGSDAPGGFGGGGGGGNDLGGGGGGFSGGGAGNPTGGGGSFESTGTGSITLRNNHGHGSVVITPIASI